MALRKNGFKHLKTQFQLELRTNGLDIHPTPTMVSLAYNVLDASELKLEHERK